MYEVLLIDDDRELGALLERFISAHGFNLRTLEDGLGLEEALAKIDYDLLILDVMLPGRDGFDLLRATRKMSDLPVIMLTARGAEGDRILGLEAGADDYLPKPFNPRELVARMQAILRRRHPTGAAPEQPIEIGDLYLQPAARSVQVNGRGIEVTGTEFDLLYHLVRQAGSVITRDELSRRVLGHPDQPYDRSLDTHISNLRRKLGSHSGGAKRIVSVRGSGYLYATAADG